MERFLSQCAEYIYNNHKKDIQNICLVFPNNRSGVFFVSYLQKLLPGVTIGPEIITVDGLISGYSELYKGEKLQLISMLYDAFKEYTKTKESFDEFYFWGEVLLADFSDIDNYLVKTEDLFSNIVDLKEIDSLFDYLTLEQKESLESFWRAINISREKPYNEKFIAVWEKLYPVYCQFKQNLKEKGIAYDGMIYRNVIEKFQSDAPVFEFDKYYIIGLNVLNSCEKKFFGYLKKQGKAVFLWDYDNFYVRDINNEAGKFIRENIKEFPSPADFSLNKESFLKKKNVKLIAVPSNYGQAQAIPRFFKENKDEIKKQFDNSAIVLADEILLFPALGAIPEKIGTVNVTMGYPVKNSVVYGFLVLLINLLKNTKKDGEEKNVVYYRYVTDLLNHQLLGNVEPEKSRNFLNRLKENNEIIVSLEDVNFSEVHRQIFSLPENVREYSKYFLKVLTLFYDLLKKDENQLLKELFYSVCQAIERLGVVVSDVYNEQGREINNIVYFKLFNQYLGQVSVAFEGEPLSGLQVMGILETRCLDFENLIILGLNENKWPKTFTAPSFIPYNLKKGFGLPGIDEQDATYSYYFYRLIQRANNITATYSTLKEGISTGELSRLGYQLFYDSHLNVKMSTLDFKFSNEPFNPIKVKGSIEKSKIILSKNYYNNPLSPTAINIWIQCSLRFYFRYILKLPEPDEMKDEIDSSIFGSIFHETIEKIYRPFVGKTINKKDIEEIKKNQIFIKNEILKAIGKHYLKIKRVEDAYIKPEGKIILIYENIKTFILKTLDIDLNYAPFRIISLESKYKTSVSIEVNSEKFEVFIGGTIDRVDKKENTLRIIDYKTGNVESFLLNDVEELFQKENEKHKKEILQALVYCYAYKYDTKTKDEIIPAIYSLRKLFDDKFLPEIKYEKSVLNFDEVEEMFICNLKELIEQIFSDKGEFYQTPYEKNCQYCPYRKICQRY